MRFQRMWIGDRRESAIMRPFGSLLAVACLFCVEGYGKPGPRLLSPRQRWQ
jgi:hypothetical protein